MSTIVALLLVGFLLLFFEVFLPGGILGLIGAGCLIAGSVVAYDTYGLMAGLGVLLGSGLAAIVFFFLEIKLLPRLPIGKQLFLKSGAVTGTSQPPVGESELIGQTGEALTTLTPTGIVRVGGRKLEAASQSGHLEPGTAVEVTAVETFRILVKEKRS